MPGLAPREAACSVARMYFKPWGLRIHVAQCCQHIFKLLLLFCRVTTDHATITRITLEVLEDMGADNVIFAELRTTPKVRFSRGYELLDDNP